jgi:prepilin-type N-terminal cleavage/methylation domain-containing protein
MSTDAAAWTQVLRQPSSTPQLGPVSAEKLSGDGFSHARDCRHPMHQALTLTQTSRDPLASAFARRSTDGGAAGAPRCSGQAGFTLIEMLVAALLLLVILTATLSFLDSTSRIGYSDVDRSQALDEQTVAFNRMLTEIGQAYAVNCPTGGCASGATSNSIDFLERVDQGSQADRRVAYNCGISQPGVSGEYECVRYQAAATDMSDAVPLGPTCSSCTATVVIQRIVKTPVFTNLATGTSGSGAVRWVSGQATIYTPSAGLMSSKVSPYTHDMVLSQVFSMPQLEFGQ